MYIKDAAKGIEAKIAVVIIQPNIPPADGITMDANKPKIGNAQTIKKKLV